MGSVNSTSSGLSNLLQSLSAESPELSSELSTPSAQSALEHASPGDLVQLSDQAVQLQQVNLLFGSSEGAQSTGLNSVSESLLSVLSSGGLDAQSNPFVQALESSAALTGTAASTTSNSQAQELDTLFGLTSAVDPLINTLA